MNDDYDKKFYGKYRGTVTDNNDTWQIGRLQVQVPDVAGETPATWALPCLPFSGDQSGFFVVPAVGSLVWVEFEQGDPDYPIWTGCFWGSSEEMPTAASQGTPSTQQVVIQTEDGNLLVISDMAGAEGGIQLKSSGGAKITVTDSGITIDNGQGAKITLNGSSVSINDGALQVS